MPQYFVENTKDRIVHIFNLPNEEDLSPPICGEDLKYDEENIVVEFTSTPIDPIDLIDLAIKLRYEDDFSICEKCFGRLISDDLEDALDELSDDLD